MKRVIQAYKRSTDGTEKPRILRDQGLIPATLSGKNIKPQNIKINKKELKKAIQNEEFPIEITIDDSKHLVDICQINKDTYKEEIMDISLVKIA